MIIKYSMNLFIEKIFLNLNYFTLLYRLVMHNSILIARKYGNLCMLLEYSVLVF